VNVTLQDLAAICGIVGAISGGFTIYLRMFIAQDGAERERRILEQIAGIYARRDVIEGRIERVECDVAKLREVGP